MIRLISCFLQQILILNLFWHKVIHRTSGFCFDFSSFSILVGCLVALNIWLALG